MRTNMLHRYFVPAVICVPLIIGFAGLSACGPMNTKKEDTQGQTATLKGVNASKNGSFLVYSGVQPAAGPAKTGSPQVGDNVFVFRSVRASDLTALSDQAKITVTYWMPDMPDMGKEDAAGARQPDGTFQAALFFGMAGRWEMTVKLEDGALRDEYVFEAKI